jgi:hypothetical protein
MTDARKPSRSHDHREKAVPVTAPDRLSMVPCSACAMRVLQVFDDTIPDGQHKLMGTITEIAGGEPVCEPAKLAVFLNRPKLLGFDDPFAFLDGWTNGYVTCELDLDAEACPNCGRPYR